VRVDGTTVGTLPASAPVRLDVGTHTLEISATGYYPIAQPVTIRSDAPTRVSVDLHPRKADDPPLVRSNPGPGSEDPPPIHRDPDAGKTQRIVGIVVAASAVIPLVIGFAGVAARGSEVGAYNADPTCPGREITPKPAACQAHIDGAGAWEAGSIVSFALAGVLAIAGGVIVFTAPSGKTVAMLRPTANGFSFAF
jgi:hypothetical protein